MKFPPKTAGALLGAAVRVAILASCPAAAYRLSAASRAYRALSGMSGTLSGCIANPSAMAANPAITTTITDNRHRFEDFDMPKHPGDELTLVFTLNGMAELEDGEGNVIWSSDEDGKWREEHPDELLGESDAEEVLTYLCDAGFVDEDELGDVEIEVDSAEVEDVSDLHGD